MPFWKEIFRRRVADWVFAPLSKAQAPDGPEPADIEPEKSYVSVTLRSMRVVHVRRGLSKFYGSVHSFISLSHLSGELASFQTVTMPNNLKDIDAQHVDRVITMEQPLLGQVPYRGGALGLEIGLYSIKSTDLTDPYLKVLESMSRAAGVSYVKTAMPFVEPLKMGINLLTEGADESILEIGVDRVLAPRTGWYLAMRAPKATTDIGQLQLDPKDNRVLDAAGKPFGDYPYMVISVTASPWRYDWFMIPELVPPYEKLRQDVRKGNAREVRESLAFFKRLVLTCSDLLRDDAKRVAKLVEDDVNSIMGTMLQAREKVQELRALDQVPLY